MYYNGNQLLNKKDINGNQPEIYICTSNRSAGKTTFFNHFLMEQYKKNNKKFLLLYRYKYELDQCSDKFFKDIKSIYYSKNIMTDKKRCQGLFYELFFDGISCGYAANLNAADALKKYSHFFNDVSYILFDEFQSETNTYLKDEPKKLVSLHTSISRGQGKMVRFVPVFLVGNPVTILNPYYITLDISARLKKDTKFLRGDGWVLEQGHNTDAATAQLSSAFNRAFAKDNYTTYSSEGVYLNDNESFIETPKGKNNYLCTLKHKNVYYSVREYPENGIIYCGKNPDMSFPIKISITTDDHNINYVMLRNNDFFIQNLRYFFEHGCFRFKDLQCKETILKALSY